MPGKQREQRDNLNIVSKGARMAQNARKREVCYRGSARGKKCAEGAANGFQSHTPSAYPMEIFSPRYAAARRGDTLGQTRYMPRKGR